MIFSSLFKTKANWQHKDAAVRISAINDELSAENAEQLQILTELIQQDESDLVRRAALIKIASFDCYLTQSQHNSQDKIKQFSAKQVQDILTTDHQIVLSEQQKAQLIAKQAQSPLLATALLEAWLAHEQDSGLMIKLYQLISARKTSSQLLSQTFNQKQNPLLQEYLLEQVEEIKVLEKLAKKACNQTITGQIEAKISTIQASIEKPQKLSKQIQLILAKLQALKDVSDYSEYKKRKAKLIHEWQALASEKTIFNADEVAEFDGKYQTIMAHLDKLFVAKAEQYQQQIISDKLAHDKQQDKKSFTQQLNQISQALTTAVFSSENLDEATFKAQLLDLAKQIQSSVLNSSEQQVFSKQVTELNQRLDKIPEIAESVSQATHLISKISQLALPKSLDELNTRQQTYNDWLKAWQVIETKTSGILPTSIVDSHKEIVQAWQSGLKALQNQQKDLFFQHKKKLQDIKRLLNNGKYKVCFGLFKGVKESFEHLSMQQQQQLQRDFDNVCQKMAELSDWEHYIATPRKQELLIAIQALVDTPLDNPNEQATKVKQFRTTWNSLGHAEEDIDKALNEQFNVACEQAFAPCRLFYAEQDKLREQHLLQRQQILEKASVLVKSLESELAEQSVNYKALEGKLNSLEQQWSGAGEVDRKQYKQLQQQFKLAVEPIKQAINDFHQANVEQKQALIKSAEQLLVIEDVFAAIESIKQLQNNWRAVGFAGNAQESRLWKQFRAVNDQLFAKRDALKSEQQAAQSNKQQVFENQILALEASLNDLDQPIDLKSLQEIKQQAQDCHREIVASKPVIKSVATRVENLIKQLEQLEVKSAQEKTQQNWLKLFSLLTEQAQQAQDFTELSSSTLFSQLTSFWQKRLQEQAKISAHVSGESRFDKTLEIEILAQVESPAELAEQRMKVQVQLMQDQMLSGNTIDLTKSLVQWLKLGTISENDLPLIKRLQQVYCN